MNHLELAETAKTKYGELSIEEENTIGLIQQLDEKRNELVNELGKIKVEKRSMEFVMAFSSKIEKDHGNESA